MTQPHPDSLRLVSLIFDHDEAGGNSPDQGGKIAGYDSFALLGAAAHRANLMLEGNGTLRKTLTPEQLRELRDLLAAMWKDGFAVGARSR
ncbi:hypothetical protein [Streptomyces sp. WAC08241]|uniref:hypothetical protein n=1 Tax=Streptomyces sp. WAC08241 TaxID=2487421 RepID=UPI000F79C06A|nr:hypothetical protein [Streptomyces sp. WAC08241]RSS37447.1 hypothetical protein EF906_23005 [Streptomyces sp. WAC08241]